MYSTSTSEYCKYVIKEPERAYPTLCKKDAAFDQSSISLHPTQILSFVVTYLRGKYILLIFSCIKPRPFKQKWKVSEVTIQEVWRGDTTHCTHSIYIHIYILIYIYKWWIHIYCYLRAVERRASRCWCSMGNPLHCQGSPVSTGCWEVLGYWVCLSLDQGSYRNRQ